ncbi:MAG: hypothetical protein A2Y65_00905 [Deltaproteobacteria bacterium RBG_13_52_11]|nr:MAG: hypothetical protein A2Y65_00905 [Deltaproteobacteria bacterium RBG_13_52_11]
MGSKKYKGKPCVYCVDGVSSDGEHIISREFFPPTYRGNLPKAPACRPCNDRKSKLEHYLTTVLPFSSDHETALKAQTDKIAQRLYKNIALKNELRSGIIPVLMKTKNGSLEDTISLPFQPEKLTEYCKYIVRGLVWYEWNVIIPKDYIVEVMPFWQHSSGLFRDFVLSLSPDLQRHKILAKGGFEYTCTRNRDDAAFSAWQLKFYENMLIAAQLTEDKLECIELCALTGPPTIRPIIERLTGNSEET